MSYQEKKNVTTILTGAAVLAGYCFTAFGKAGPGVTAPEDLRAWAVLMLEFVSIFITATIIIQIVFHVLLSVGIAVREAAKGSKEIGKAIDGEMVEDERDKLIELKSSKISLSFGGFGFVTGLVFLAFGFPAALALNVMFIVFFTGSVVEGFVQLFLYRRGVKHA